MNTRYELRPIVFLGAASLDVKQEIEYCMPEARMTFLLAALQKTAPPVNRSY